MVKDTLVRTNGRLLRHVRLQSRGRDFVGTHTKIWLFLVLVYFVSPPCVTSTSRRVLVAFCFSVLITVVSNFGFALRFLGQLSTSKVPMWLSLFTGVSMSINSCKGEIWTHASALGFIMTTLWTCSCYANGIASSLLDAYAIVFAQSSMKCFLFYCGGETVCGRDRVQLETLEQENEGGKKEIFLLE